MRRIGAFPRHWFSQAALLATMLATIAWGVANLVANLGHRRIAAGFDFLGNAARFPIAETFVAYTPMNDIAHALVAGVANTAALTILVTILSTLLGIPLALARRSGHPLARVLAGGVIDLLRNTPLVIQLLFWYALLTVGLPTPVNAMQPVPGVFMTDRGLFATRLGLVGSAFPMFLLWGAGLGATAILAWRGRLHAASVATVLTVSASVVLWFSLDLAVSHDVPRLTRFGFAGGLRLTPEFAAVLIGSVVYASAFAAEIVRSGVDGVAIAQWDAADALGLNRSQALRLVVMPQALRIMVPPMTNQFVGVLKNTTLAIVVGYPDANFVANTVINHSGQAIEVMVILCAVYLLLAGAISLAMGRLNAAFAKTDR